MLSILPTLGNDQYSGVIIETATSPSPSQNDDVSQFNYLSFAVLVLEYN